jgi:outer membrane protein assembly factor BamB
VAPAIALDGTIYTVSRAHFNARYSYVVAVNPDLSRRWATSLRGLVNDGCGGLLPIGTSLDPPTPNACRVGTPRSGVDPATNEPPAGRAEDVSSSSPTVLPDGSVLYGAFTAYNHSRGHLFKLGPDGHFLASYDFGWDTTPAVYPHDGTYSVVTKENRYGVGSYCRDAEYCPREEEGPFYITQLDSNLVPEWQFLSTETESCVPGPNDAPRCMADHPNGFEWCINAPAVDADGVVYANGEDGYLYAIAQGGGILTAPRQRIFLSWALGAAYTPLALGPDGRVYTENGGQLFAVGD